MAITKAQQARQMYKKGSKKPVKQAGVMNYRPSEMITVPRIAKSSPTTPTAKLAYITPEEENILVDLNLYGSLKGKPNRGPGGLPSLEGDFGPGGTGDYDRSGADRDVSDRRDTGTGNYERVKEKDVQKAREQRAKQINASKEAEARRQAAIEFERRQKEKIAQERAIREKEERKKRGLAATTKFGTPVGPMSPSQRSIIGLEKIGLAKSAIEDDDDDDKATAKAIVEQNPLEKFLSNIKPPSVALIEGILDKIPGKSLREMYDIYGGDYKTFDDYERDVLAGKISTKGGPMGGFFRDGQGNLIGGRDGPDNQIIPTTTGSVTPEEEVDNRTELEKLLDARGPAYRFFADGGIADDDDPVGGIMDLESGRQMYFAGKLVKSIGKGLKSITKGIKKVAKSPIGKAAILGAIGFGIPGTQFGGLFGTATKKGILGKYGLGQTLGIMGKSPGALGGKTPGLGGLLQRALGFIKDKPLTSIFGASILAGLTPQEKQKLLEQEEEEGLDIAAIRGGEPYRLLAEGGKAEPVAKKTMPLIDMDGMEKDYRETGGFVEMGRMERADDVPARLSKNEFVFTADAVRNAGEGDIDKGAEVMYNMMKNLESGGEVSEESQGLEGAKKMFQTSQRLGEVI